MAFSLPPGIRAVRKMMPDGIPSSVFHNDKLGQLGSAIVRPDPSTGLSQLDALLAPAGAGDPRARREDRFRAVVTALHAAIDARYGPSPDRSPSMPPPEMRDTAVVGHKLMQCRRCGAVKSHRVFAPGATTVGDLETQARRVHAKIVKIDLPTWVVGVDMDTPYPEDFAALVRKVWPKRKTVRRLTSDGLEAQLDRVVCGRAGEGAIPDCGSPTKSRNRLTGHVNPI